MSKTSNDERIHSIQSQELRMCSVRSLMEFMQMAIDGNRATFNLDVVTLRLIDNDYEIRRVLEGQGINLKTCSSMSFVDEASQLPSFRQPRIGPYEKAHAHIFPNNENIAWVAELPLRSQNKFYGALNFGSSSQENFNKKLDDQFLQHMCAIAGLCLENALNQERLKYAGLIDPLTEVNNRRFFDQRIKEEIDRTQRSTEPLTCLYMDIDRFKQINDEYGHSVGDQVLREVASIIKKQLRSCDTLARYGGEEFVALLINTKLDDAIMVAERIRSSIEAQALDILSGHRLKVTLSIGLSQSNMKTAESSVDKLLEDADHALLTAKHSGRNRVIVSPG